MESLSTSPDWDLLFEIALGQDGLFTTEQAAEAGYSPQLLAHHLGSGNITRVRRGVYRIVHFPAGDHEELTTLWLWSEHQGVFSHQTALALHDLSDVLPSNVHMTLPLSWRRRRLRVPEGVVLHFAEVSEDEMKWIGPIPVTGPLRTLNDCADGDIEPDILRSAARDSLDQGLVERGDLELVEARLEVFGGLER